MDKNKKMNPEKENQQAEKKKQDEALDRELEQTFPASDPPSHSRPGKEDEKKVKKEK